MVDCLQALSQTHFLGRSVLNGHNLKQPKTKENAFLSTSELTFSTPLSESCLLLGEASLEKKI